MQFKYENPKSLQETNGWTDQDIEKYLTFLESADPETLRTIHKKAGINMFSDNEPVDPEQAIFVLTGGHDISKEELFKILDEYL